MSSRSLSAVRSRQIGQADVNDVAALLGRGFPRRSRDYWRQALDRLAKHSTPADMPRYGYLLESEGVVVGVILLISSMFQDSDKIRCNVSSWYVEPKFRFHAPLLISQATRMKNITYINISPAKHTLSILEAQGFTRFSDGQFVSSVFPRGRHGARARVVRSDVNPNAHFEPFEQDLLLAHAQYGCLSLWCTTTERAYPFVFISRIVKRVVPCAQLIYCRHMEDFIEFARPIGSYLALHGTPFVLIDSKGPIPGLVGRYFDGASPKYSKGPVVPRLGDLAYTEAAMLPDL